MKHKKNYLLANSAFIILLHTILSFTTFAEEKSNILIKEGDIVITSKDAIAMLGDMTWEQKQRMLNDEEKFKSLLLDYLTLKKQEKSAIDNNIHTKQTTLWKLNKSRAQILAGEMISNYQENLDIPGSVESLAKDAYDANPEKYKVEERVSVSHILIPMNNDEEIAQKEALRIIQEIKDGLDFEEAAKKYSSDKGSAKNGGVINYFGRGQMVLPFEEKAFSMKSPEEISEPVKTKFGFHILKFIGRIDASIITFEKAKAALIATEKRKYIKQQTNEYLKSFATNKNTNIYIPPFKLLLEEEKNKLNNPYSNK